MVQIRAMRPEDAEALAGMANLPGFRFNTGRLPFGTIAMTRSWIEALGPRETGVVAEMDGVVVGSASLERMPARRSHCALLHMGVHDDWTRRGVGTALMAALIDLADRWLGLRRLELTVFVDNTAGLALYTRFGFEPEGTLRGFALRDGVYVDAFIMARWVEAPARAT